MIKKITVTLALLIASTSYAINLEGINGVEILAIDGQKVKSSFFSKQKSDLSKGEHQIVVRYVKQFKNDDIIKSRPAIFSIDLQQDTQISASGINNQRQAEKAMSKGFVWQVSSTNQQYSVENSAQLKGSGFMPYQDIEGLIVTYNQENGMVLPAKVDKEVVITQKTAKQSNLISLYQSASKEDKKVFRLWLLEQDMK